MTTHFELTISKNNIESLKLFFSNEDRALNYIYFNTMVKLNKNTSLFTLVYSDFKKVNSISLGDNIDKNLVISKHNNYYKKQIVDMYYQHCINESYKIKKQPTIFISESLTKAGALLVNGELTNSFKFNEDVMNNPFSKEFALLSPLLDTGLTNQDINNAKFNPKSESWDINEKTTIRPIIFK